MRKPAISSTVMGAALALSSCIAVPSPDTAALSCAARMAGAQASFDLHLKAKDGRDIPVTVFHPDEPGTYPVIAFSHGAFAAPKRYTAMLRPMAAAGFIIVAPMHRDSEEFGLASPPSQEEVWLTRHADFAIALSKPDAMASALASRAIVADDAPPIAMGHSYGAIIAQLSAGAQSLMPAGRSVDAPLDLQAVIAWSPPGEAKGMIENAGWSTMATPSMVLTGTTDILPGFVDDWEDRKASFIHAPAGNKALWVGNRIDHYFGGMFGRVKPADANSQGLMQRALERSVQFLDENTGRYPACSLEPSFNGEQFVQG